MKTLANFLPIKAMIQRSKEFSEYFWDRWDAPKGEWVPADLRDRRPQMSSTEDGRSIASQILHHEMLDQSQYNPVLVALLVLLPFLAVVMAIPEALSASKGIETLTTVIALATVSVIAWLLFQNREEAGTVFKTVGLGFFVPMIGLAASKVGSQVLFSMATKLWLLFLVAGALFLILLLMSVVAPRAKESLSATTKFLSVGVAFLIAASIIHPALAFPACLVLGSYAPMLLVRKWDQDSSDVRLSMGITLNGEQNGRLTHAHIEPRREQAEACARDKTQTMLLATSTGELYDRGDHYAADVGLPMLISQSDLSTHILIIGETGSGKSYRCLNRFITEQMAINESGILYIDAKGEGPLKFSHLPGYTLVRPTERNRTTGEVIHKGVNIGLIQGMAPGSVCDVLAEVGGVKADAQQSGNAQFFINHARNLVFNAEQLLWWMIKAHENKNKVEGTSATRHWTWSLAGVLKMTNLLADTSKDANGRRMIEDIADFVDKWALVGSRDDVLNQALRFARSGVLSIAEEAKEAWGGIVGQAQQWFTPLMNSNDLHAWSTCEVGDFDMGQVMHGAHVGLYLPVKYGTAGVMATALIRRRISLAMQERPDNWRELDPTATPLLMVFDEFQEIINTMDLKNLSMGRSWGLWMVMATQSIAAIENKLGKEATQSALNNFLSVIAFRVDESSYEFIQRRVGKCFRKKKRGYGAGIDHYQTLELMTNLPTQDWDHPSFNARWEHMAASGAGRPVPERVQSRNQANMTSRTLDYEETMKYFAQNNRLTHFVQAEGSEEQYILDMAVLSMLSKGHGNAFMQINRGGVARRDIVKMNGYPVPTAEQFNALRAQYAVKKIENRLGETA